MPIDSSLNTCYSEVAAVKKIDDIKLVEVKSISEGVKITEILATQEINQRPRRQIIHKYIKDRRPTMIIDLEQLNGTSSGLNESDDYVKMANAPIVAASTVITKIATNVPALHKPNPLPPPPLLRPPRLPPPTLPQLNQEKLIDHHSPAIAPVKRGRGRPRRVLEPNVLPSPVHLEEHSNSSESSIVQLVEIIADDDDNEYEDDSKSYELMDVVDSPEAATITVEQDSNDVFVVTVDKTIIDDDSNESSKKIYVEVSESMDSQEIVELKEVVTYEDSTSSSNSCSFSIHDKTTVVALKEPNDTVDIAVMQLSQLESSSGSGGTVVGSPKERENKLGKKITSATATRQLTRLNSVSVDQTSSFLEKKKLNEEISLEKSNETIVATNENSTSISLCTKSLSSLNLKARISSTIDKLLQKQAPVKDFEDDRDVNEKNEEEPKHTNGIERNYNKFINESGKLLKSSNAESVATVKKSLSKGLFLEELCKDHNLPKQTNIEPTSKEQKVDRIRSRKIAINSVVKCRPDASTPPSTSKLSCSNSISPKEMVKSRISKSPSTVASVDVTSKVIKQSTTEVRKRNKAQHIERALEEAEAAASVTVRKSANDQHELSLEILSQNSVATTPKSSTESDNSPSVSTPKIKTKASLKCMPDFTPFGDTTTEAPISSTSSSSLKKERSCRTVDIEATKSTTTSSKESIKSRRSNEEKSATKKLIELKSKQSTTDNKPKSLSTKSKTNPAVAAPEKKLDTYAILSNCYLPKLVKNDESQFSIEALRAAEQVANAVTTIASTSTERERVTLALQMEQNARLARIKASEALAESKKEELLKASEIKAASAAIEVAPMEIVNESLKTELAPIDVKNEEESSSPTEEETNIRRSGRIKSITETKQRSSRGYGLVRDREDSYAQSECGSMDFSDFDNSVSSSGVAPIPLLQERLKTEAELEKEARDVVEGLNLFTQIVENEFRSERSICRQAKGMQCDCFLTGAELVRGELGCGEDCLNRMLMIECGSRCVVGDRCTNRRFQKRQNSDCSIFKTEMKGFGLRANSFIRAGDFIMEYVGEVLNSQQFESRANEYSQEKNRHHYFMALRSDCVIDATIRGNISRFINHSCDPNAETQKWTVNGELRIGFFSSKNIYMGEEITFDYQFQRYGKAAQRCFCEAECCRGWIGEEPDSDEELDGEEEEEEDEIEDDEDEYDDEEDVGKVFKREKVAKDMPSKNETEVKASLNKIVDSTLSLTIENEPHVVSKEPIKVREKTVSEVSGPVISADKNPKIKRKTRRIKRPITPATVIDKAEKQLRKLKTKRAEIMEDPDLDMEIDQLTKSNLKNQAHTLRFNRLMIRAKLQRARSQLLYILRNGELACRRLFLDYHGLKLLYTWICDSGIADRQAELKFRLEILETLEVLPIPNKLMLQDSKVLETVQSWVETDSASTIETHALPLHLPAPLPPTQATTSLDVADPKVTEALRNIDLDALKQIITTNECNEKNRTEQQQQQKQQEQILPQNETTEIFTELMEQIHTIATKLASAWDNLPEVFRIPKKMRIEQMKEHEREANRNYRALGLFDETERNKRRYQDRYRSRDGKEQQQQRIEHEKERCRPTIEQRPPRYRNDSDFSLSKIARRQMFEAKVEAEKRRTAQEAVHVAKCTFFRLDPRQVHECDVPFCVNPFTGQWYAQANHMVPTPPSHVSIIC